MARSSAMSEGFRAVVRNPGLLVAELAWRWAFGAAAAVLIGVSVYEVQRAVTISPTDELLIASMQPMLVAQAWAHILQQTWPLLARVTAILLPALSVMWIAAATIGRAVTIGRLVEWFGVENPHPLAARSGWGISELRRSTRWGALAALHAFRAAVALAVVLGYIGSALLASQFVDTGSSGEAVPDIEFALIVFVLIFSVVMIVAAAINWVLSLAPVFTVRDERRTWESLGDALRMFRERGSEFTAAATMNGFLRFALACAATVAGIVPFTLLGQALSWLVWGAVGIVTLTYFVVSDWLLLARLGSYVAIVEKAAEEKNAANDVNAAKSNQLA